MMREGAWIIACNGEFKWVQEHAIWLQDPAHARDLGLPQEAIEKVRSIPWDFNGPGRAAICLEGMRHGLIRFRGHGASVTLESVLPLETVLKAAEKLMAACLGPWMMVEVHRLDTGEAWFSLFKDILAHGPLALENR